MDVITASIATADDVNRLGPSARAEGIEWLARQGYPLGERMVFQIEHEIIDCPLIRTWWLTRDEVTAIPSADLASTNGDIRPFAHVTETALRDDLPSWWQPDAA